jgi:hypothetical protein
MPAQRSRLWLGVAVALPIAAAGAALLVWAWHAGSPWFERHVLFSYCVTNPNEQRFVTVARRIGAILGALLLLIAPLLVRWGSRRRPIDVLTRVAAVVAAVVAALGTAELWLRHRESRAQQRPEVIITPINRYDSRIGWTFEPNQRRVLMLGGRKITYYINANGDRARSLQDLPDRSRPTILIAGESATFGHALHYDETFGGLIEHDTGIQVVNLSVTGYGLDQQYLHLVDELPKYEHPIAVIVPFLLCQLARTGVSASERPHLALGKDGALVQVPAHPRWRIAKLWTDEPYHSDDQLDTASAILAATAKVIEARGIRPTFLVLNADGCRLGDGLSLPWVVHELFERPHLPYVRFQAADDEVITPIDRHPDARANRRLSEVLERALNLPRRSGADATGG